MEKVLGVDILIMANTGTEALPEYTPVGGQRSASLSIKRGTIEMGDKLGDYWEDPEYGRGSWSISCSGVYAPNETAYKALVTALIEGEKVLVRWEEKTGITREGLAIVESNDLEADWEAEATYSMTLKGKGKPQEITVP